MAWPLEDTSRFLCVRGDSLQSPPKSAESRGVQEASIHIINDLERDVQFCNRLYVTGGPKARFYAGVPITTPKGITIGAYCCLDDKPRHGVSESDVNFMKDMATTVMTYLETLRAKSEHERGLHMVTGLGAFVEGANGSQSWSGEGSNRGRKKPSGPQAGENVIASMAENISESHQRRHSYLSESSCNEEANLPEIERSSPAPARQATTNKDSHLELHYGETSNFPTMGEQAVRNKQMKGTQGHIFEDTPDFGDFPHLSRGIATSPRFQRPGERYMDASIHATFQRAVRHIQEGLEADGAVFLDANIETFGGLVENKLSNTDSTSSSEGFTSNFREREVVEDASAQTLRSSEKLCRIYSSSETTAPPVHDELSRPSLLPKVPEILLKTLLRRYPRGKIWSFNDEGFASSDDESSEATQSGDCRSQSPERSHLRPTATSYRSGRRKRARIEDGREICRLFPGVRSVVLVGMWDSNRKRWFSACAVWSYSPLRVFSTEMEVNYLAAFCDVIMADIHRLEAQNSDNMKSDFLSSISHELRTPLHGILGSAECLHDQVMDPFSRELISQVEACGRTLVDIIDHVLDFTKAHNHMDKVAQNIQAQSAIRSTSMHITRTPSPDQTLEHNTEVSLDEVTEEVVQTSLYSHFYSQSKDQSFKREVTVILDFDKEENIGHWRCYVPLGAWKRTCLNLINNALKYTDDGYI